jgi:thiol-disulfide isomerase/thioredoxin
MSHAWSAIFAVWSPIVVVIAAAAAQGADEREVRGLVVDEMGKPVAGAAVADFWRANGTGRDRDGKYLNLKIEANAKEFWGSVGSMQTFRSSVVRTGADGRFVVPLGKRSHAVMAMDQERKRGGLVILPKGKETEPVEIRLGPLVTVRGSLRGPQPGQVPSWTHIYVHIPRDGERPLDSLRLVSCGSFEARFAFSLPPGRYTIEGYNETSDAYTIPEVLIDLSPGERELDLDELRLTDVATSEYTKFIRARDAKDWLEFEQRVGKRAPQWQIADAQGISKDHQLSDFRGKWVMIYFWGFGCAPCLGKGLPNMVKFYEEHVGERDRFECVAFCVDEDSRKGGMSAVEKKLEPIVKNVWGGKPLPFPSVLDGSFETMERFGLRYFGPVLIDPEGRLVKGDETVLAEKLGKGRVK